MSESSSSTSSGIGFTGLLTIVFITLKLLDKIDWSWWWVLSPIWISAGLVIAILLLFGIGAVIAALIK
jgi:hypothetical protein